MQTLSYDDWNELKKEIALKETQYSFKEGEIWWCSLGVNLGTESLGKGEGFQRPILIIKKLSKDACIGIPLTTKFKVGTWFAEIIFHSEKRYAMLYQIRMLHTKRFQRRIGTIDHEMLLHVKEKLRALLELHIIIR